MVATKGMTRREASEQLIALSYAATLWTVFQWHIAKAISKLEFLADDLKSTVFVAITDQVEEWLTQALLLDHVGLQRHTRAEMNCES